MRQGGFAGVCGASSFCAFVVGCSCLLASVGEVGTSQKVAAPVTLCAASCSCKDPVVTSAVSLCWAMMVFRCWVSTVGGCWNSVAGC